MARHFRSDEGAQDAQGKVGWRWTLVAVALGVLIAVLLRVFVIGVYYVPSGSMLDTIHEGDLILGERVSLALGSPEQGDVVTFESPLDPDETLVKRVIAVGGQTVDLVDGEVWVDGEPLDEPYVSSWPTVSLSELEGSAGITYPYVVPEGYVWVMGDNRTNSRDSRYFGPVSVDDVTSRAILIYWPLPNAGLL